MIDFNFYILLYTKQNTFFFTFHCRKREQKQNRSEEQFLSMFSINNLNRYVKKGTRISFKSPTVIRILQENDRLNEPLWGEDENKLAILWQVYSHPYDLRKN